VLLVDCEVDEGEEEEEDAPRHAASPAPTVNYGKDKLN
jgi:hypothetical protein